VALTVDLKLRLSTYRSLRSAKVAPFAIQYVAFRLLITSRLHSVRAAAGI
jgi:hypothetical protein